MEVAEVINHARKYNQFKKYYIEDKEKAVKLWTTFTEGERVNIIKTASVAFKNKLKKMNDVLSCGICGSKLLYLQWKIPFDGTFGAGVWICDGCAGKKKDKPAK